MAAPDISFVMLSAGTGQPALDEVGDDDRYENSVLTRMLIKQLQMLGAVIDEIAKNVRRIVVSIAKTINHYQRPAFYDEMRGKFYFVKPSGGVARLTNASAVKGAFAPAKRPSIENKNRRKTGVKGRTSDANLTLLNASFWKVLHDAYPIWAKAQESNAGKLQAYG